MCVAIPWFTVLSHSLIASESQVIVGDFHPSFVGLEILSPEYFGFVYSSRCALAAVNSQVSFRCSVVTDVDMLVLLAAASTAVCSVLLCFTLSLCIP